MSKKTAIIIVSALIIIILLSLKNTFFSHNLTSTEQTNNNISGSFDQKKFKTEAQWKKILTPSQYHILREQGTEIPFSGKLAYEKRSGTYVSAGCNEPVFRSEKKYESGTGWPSFWAPITPDALVLRVDNSIPSEPRVEVLDKCGGHLGHVFNDGPKPTGKRYCMNSEALLFIPDKIH